MFVSDPEVGVALKTAVAATPAAVGDAVAAVLFEAIDRTRRAGRGAVIGWPVGRTPRVIVDSVVRTAADLDLSDVTFALMDDFVNHTADGGWQRIDVALPHSCRGTAIRDLVAPLDQALPAGRRLRVDNLWSPDPTDPLAFEARIARAGGIDVFVVALGAGDGHVALNPPGSALDSRTRVVRVADTTRRDNLGTFPQLATLDDVPTHGVTVGLGTICDARRIAVVAHGEGKRDAVAALCAADGFDDRLPMTAVLTHPDVTLHCDTAARPVDQVDQVDHVVRSSG